MIGDIIVGDNVYRKLPYGERRTWLRTQKGKGWFKFTKIQHLQDSPNAYCPECKKEITLAILIDKEFCPGCVVAPTEIEFRGWF